MAEEEGSGGAGAVWWVVGGIIFLIAMWFASGAYKTADVGGLFLQPPPPVGTGESYGPQDYQVNVQQQ